MRTNSNNGQSAPPQPLEARYAYYRRCQQFLRNGRQCKAPAMKETHICRQHSEQKEMRQRHERQRVALQLPNFFLDFRALNRAIGLAAQAVIDGRLDCKAAGRLALEMQTASQLLRLLQRQRKITNRGQQFQRTDVACHVSLLNHEGRQRKRGYERRTVRRQKVLKKHIVKPLPGSTGQSSRNGGPRDSKARRGMPRLYAVIPDARGSYPLMTVRRSLDLRTREPAAA